MMNKLLKRLVLMTLIAGIIFFFLVGKVVDRIYNRIDETEGFIISQAARDLHSQLSIVDLHADNLLWDRNPTAALNHGHVDLPRLKKGNYTLQVFDAVIQTPKNLNYQSNSGDTDNVRLLAMVNRWPVDTWYNLTNRAIHQSKVLHDAAQSDAGLTIIRSVSDLEYYLKLRKNNSYLIGGLLAIEGLHALENNLQNLDVLYDHGYRILGLVHFFDNEVGGSSAGVDQGGLTRFGQAAIRKMDEMNLIIDLAHASEALIDDVLSVTRRPVMVSHTGVDGIHDSPRNLSDRHIRAIASTGGLIGIGFWVEAAGGTHPRDIAKSIRYVADLVGVGFVALGSDFDGAITASFDSSQIIYITEALIREGFSPEEIKRIMGANALQFLRQNLPPA